MRLLDLEKIKPIIEKVRDNRKWLLTLSILVVFITTYMLILPAFTLEKDEAEEQGGIDLPVAEETVADESVPAEETEAAEAEMEASESEEPSEMVEKPAAAEFSGEEKEAIADPAEETREKGEAAEEATEEITAEEKTAKEEKNVEKTEETQEEEVEKADPLTYEGENYKITVVDKKHVLPENTEIIVEEIDKDGKENKEDKELYKQYFDDTIKAFNDDEKTPQVEDLEFAHFYYISLVANGKEIKAPKDAVEIKVEYDEELAETMKVEDTERLQIINFVEDKKKDEIEAEILDAEKLEVNTDKKDRLTDVTFEAERFTVEESISLYGVVSIVEATEEAAKDEVVKEETTEEQTAAANPLTFEGEGYKVIVVDNDNVLPAHTEIKVKEIDEKEDAEAYKQYYDESVQAVNDDKKTPNAGGLSFARFYDITLVADGEEIKTPEDSVSVRIEYDDALSKEMNVEDQDKLHVIHFAEDEKTGETKPEILEKETVEVNTDKKDNLTDTTFEADSFSVYGVVYTVDFHYTVNGKTYNFSITGGSYITVQQLVEVLEIANSDETNEEAQAAEEGNEEDSENTQVDIKLTLADLEISDKTKEFVADVEKVEFSSPELVWVGKAEDNTTVGALKETNGLECQYSGVLSDEQLEEINNSVVENGDWALISLQPFTSDETLTVTMKNGDQFVINVTDAEDPSIFDGKEVIIYDNGEKRAMLSTGYDYNNGHRLDSTPLAEADNNQNARWTVQSVDISNNRYYLRNNSGYLRLQNNSASVVTNQTQATVFYIERGNNPDYCLHDAYNTNNILTYSDNGTQWDGFFSGQSNTEGSTQQWLYIREAQTPVPEGGDWMLYFDDDFSEITIHVGDTITLRPYNKWEWKEGNVDVQTDHWIVGGSAWSDWTITSSDSTGARYATTTDGPFLFTRFVKADDQLITHYWSVQGKATQTGDYTLTNTKNGKTITVHVVDGDPVSKPDTIDKIANIKVNLFDYDRYGTLDPADDTNLANTTRYKNESVNQMGGNSHFYFLSSGSGNHQAWQNREYWNDYTQDDSNPNLVRNTLDGEGYPVLNFGNNTSLKYLFDKTQTSWHGGNSNDGMIAYPDVVGMFQKDPTTGYYYFNSNTNYFYYDTESKTSKLYEHTYTQLSKSETGNYKVNDKPIGFFPFRDYGTTQELYVNQNAELNHHLGLSMELEFMLPRDKKDDNGNDIIFDFSGDDDLWVFVEWVDDNGNKQSKLLLDLGGVHQPIHGDINFTTGSNTSDMEPNRPYTLKVFYLERGGCDSNCSIRFNLPIVQDLTVAKKLTGLTADEMEKYKNEVFTYEIVVNGQPYNYPNPNNKYEKAVLRNAAGEDITPANFKIVNGRVDIQDGQTLTITYLDRSDKFTVAELNTDNMANFEAPNAERYYHLSQDASLYEEEITLTESQTISEPHTADWVTPEYKLEDTEKVTFTNTLKEKNLEVEKEWIGNKTHPDSITFTVSATVEDGQGGRVPYAVKELKESDGTTDKTFTLSNSNNWREEIEHLPVYTPEPDSKFIFYDINEGHVEGYVLTGSRDITADHYNYCNVDVVKLWPDSNGEHSEIIRVVLKNSAGKYYAGVDSQGEAIFVDDIADAQDCDLTRENNYTYRFPRVPARDSQGENEIYTAVQLTHDDFSKGLSTYVRDIIQYELENTPLEDQIDPAYEPNVPVIHKRIDALRDGVENLDSPHSSDEDLTDLYRLYLDYTINSKQDTNGIDLLFVIDHSGSMNNSEWPGNQYRAPAVMNALNGQNGFISKFLGYNTKNRWAAVGFKGPKSSDYTWSLSNPWQPETAAATSNTGQNGSEVLSTGSTFNRDAANISLPNEGADKLSNYTAGFWRAEQYLLDESIKTDGRKKVVVFITDGVPTLHIDNLGGSLENAGTAAGSPYYREEYGGCPDKARTEFGYFVNDLTSNGYSFGGDNGNIEFYTIGLGSSMQTESGIALLNGLLDVAYGADNHSGHNMTISDSSTSASTVSGDLSKDLRIILGMNDTFSNLVIQDDLSKYVDLYGLTSGASPSAIMDAAKAIVTMKVPDPDEPSGSRIVTLYKDGAPVNSPDAKFTKQNGDEATIIQELTYDENTKTVKAIFDPEYHPANDVTFTLSFDVKATDTAYATYAATGYDKYTSGDHQGEIIVGDPDTDFLGTNPANATSVDKPGFRSNDEAKATYQHNNENEKMVYPHPVIQVAAKADIVKIDENGAALEGAKFNLYDDRYDASKTIEENAAYLIEKDLQSKKPTDPAGDDAVIRSGKLTPGTYYLVETEAPARYNTLEGPVKITITETNGVLSIAAEIDGKSIVDKIDRIGNGYWKLSVQNTAGYELPNSGGIGTTLFYVFGSMLLIGNSIFLISRRRMKRS